MKDLKARLGQAWCRLFHRKRLSRPMHGKYRCWRCLREFETDF